MENTYMSSEAERTWCCGHHERQWAWMCFTSRTECDVVKPRDAARPRVSMPSSLVMTAALIGLLSGCTEQPTQYRVHCVTDTECCTAYNDC